MKCYDVRRKLSALLDGAAEGDLRDAVARHLDGCPSCRAEIEALAGVDQAVVRTLRAMEEAPEGYHEGLWERLEGKLGPDPELDEIRRLAAQVVGQATPKEPEAVSAASTTLGQVMLPSAGPPRRRGSWWAIAGAVAAAAAAVVVVMLARPRDERVQPPPTTGPEPPQVAVAPPAPAEATREAPEAKEQPAPAPPVAAVEKKKEASGERKPSQRKAGETPPVEAPGAAVPAKEAGPRVEEIFAPPPPPPAAAPLPEKIGHEEIEKGMAKIASRVQACFDLHAIQGKVMVKVKIMPDGTVGAADAEGKHADTDAGACVVKAVKEATFAAFNGPPMTVRYPFQAE